MLPCILAKLFNLCITAGCVPESFGRSYTVPILKDKNAVFCKTLLLWKTCSISVSPVISKVFKQCILDRFSDYLVTSDNQFGFKKQLSCSRALYTLRYVVDAFVNSGSAVNTCALDISLVLDKVNYYGFLLSWCTDEYPTIFAVLFWHRFSIGSTCVKCGA